MIKAASGHGAKVGRIPSRHKARFAGRLAQRFTSRDVVACRKRGLLTLWRNRVLQYAAMRITCDMRIELFRHMQTLSLRYFGANQTCKVVTRIAQDAGELYNLTNSFFINLIAETVTVVGVLCSLTRVE